MKNNKKKMKVVFIQNHGNNLAWDIKEVKEWFARNLLIPREIAFPATEKIIAETEDLRKKWEEIRAERKKQALDAKSKLSWASLEFIWKADWDTLYASITEKDISVKIKENYSVDIDPKHIKHWHLKTVWIHQVEANLTDWVIINIKVEVLAEWQEKKERAKKEEKSEEEIEEVVEETEGVGENEEKEV